MTPNYAVAYLRVSGLAQCEGDGFTRQREACDKHTELAGLSIVGEYRELGISGKTGEEDRPAFQAMIADMLSNGFKTIIVESLDRLARQYDVQQQLATYIASKGLTLISANTGEDITAALMGDPMRRALVQIQGIFAELDKNMLVAKLRKARARTKSKVGRCEGVKPFGSKDGEGTTLARMRSMKTLGYKNEAIAHLLNQEGYPTRSGKPWNPSTIAKITGRKAPAENYGAITLQ